MEISIRLKKLREGAVVPSYETAGAAAADLSACMEEEIVLQPGQRALIPTGLALALPSPDYVAVLAARSGLAAKKGIALANGIGIIDSDYRGELCAALINQSQEPFTVHPGDRIAQLMILPVARAAFEVTEALDDTARGAGGFGSTGV